MGIINWPVFVAFPTVRVAVLLLQMGRQVCPSLKGLGRAGDGQADRQSPYR